MVSSQQQQAQQRFKLEIPGEGLRHYSTRRAALAYIRQRQTAGTLPEGAKLRDNATGTVLRTPANAQAPTKTAVNLQTDNHPAGAIIGRAGLR